MLDSRHYACGEVLRVRRDRGRRDVASGLVFCPSVFVCWSLVNRVGNAVTHPTRANLRTDSSAGRGLVSLVNVVCWSFVLSPSKWCDESHPTSGMSPSIALVGW